MGRKKKAEATIEKLNDDQLYELTCHHKEKYEVALAAKKKAAADFLNVTRLAKSDHVSIDDIKDMIALESDDGEEKLRGQVERRLRSMRWAGLTVGTQPGLFDAASTNHFFDEGKRAGLKGETAKPPSQLAPGSDHYSDWLLGHAAGQATIAKGFKAPANDEGDVRPRFKQTDDPGDAVDSLARPH